MMNQFLKRTVVAAVYLLVVMGLLALVLRQGTDTSTIQARLAARLQHGGWHVAKRFVPSVTQTTQPTVKPKNTVPVVDARALDDIIQSVNVKPLAKPAPTLPAPKPVVKAPKAAPIEVVTPEPKTHLPTPVMPKVMNQPKVVAKPKPTVVAKPKPVVASTTHKPAPIQSIDLSVKDFYAIQVASYEDEDRAYDTIATLMDKGYMAWLENSGDRWRVMVGRAPTKDALSYDREQLQLLMKLPKLPMVRHVVGSDIAR